MIVSVANSTGSLRRQEPTMIVVEEIDERRQTVKGWDRAGNRGFAKPVSAMSVDERQRAYLPLGDGFFSIESFPFINHLPTIKLQIK